MRELYDELISQKEVVQVILMNGFQMRNVIILWESEDTICVTSMNSMEDECRAESIVFKHAISTIVRYRR